MVPFADFTDEPSCVGGNSASIIIAQQLVFHLSEFPLSWHALKADKTIKGYEGYFPNQAFVPSVLFPYKEKLRMIHLFEQLTRTNADIKMAAF